MKQINDREYEARLLAGGCQPNGHCEDHSGLNVKTNIHLALSAIAIVMLGIVLNTQQDIKSSQMVNAANIQGIQKDNADLKTRIGQLEKQFYDISKAIR